MFLKKDLGAASFKRSQMTGRLQHICENERRLKTVTVVDDQGMYSHISILIRQQVKIKYFSA